MVFQVTGKILEEELSKVHARNASRRAYYDQIVESLVSARLWLRLAEIAVPILLAITICTAWEDDRRDRARLAGQLAAAQQTIAAATAREKTRDDALSQTLAQIDELKRTVITPEQILKALPNTISLPAPITLQPNVPPAAGSVGASFSPSPSTSASPGEPRGANSDPGTQLPANPAPKPNGPNAVVPSADLKPLYDFALDCKACQAKLAASQSDLADEKTKTAALTQQRDAAVQAAKGGSALRRIARAAKWFILGAAAGAVAAKAAH
jgi:hypothetical protein